MPLKPDTGTLPTGLDHNSSNIAVRIRGCGSYTNAVYSSSPDTGLTKIQPGNPEGLCKAQNIYRTFEGPRCESLA
jgi:hypothetical protein